MKNEMGSWTTYLVLPCPELGSINSHVVFCPNKKRSSRVHSSFAVNVHSALLTFDVWRKWLKTRPFVSGSLCLLGVMNEANVYFVSVHYVTSHFSALRWQRANQSIWLSSWVVQVQRKGVLLYFDRTMTQSMWIGYLQFVLCPYSTCLFAGGLQ